MLRRFSFSPQEQNHRVTHVIVSQNYNQETMKSDLSLLKVKPGIQFTRWARPICLPSLEVAGSDWKWGPPPGTICTAVGWGATEESGPDRKKISITYTKDQNLNFLMHIKIYHRMLN